MSDDVGFEVTIRGEKLPVPDEHRQVEEYTYEVYDIELAESWVNIILRRHPYDFSINKDNVDNIAIE
jgi:hypothetical protein